MEDVIDGEVVGEDVAVGGELVHVPQAPAQAMSLFGASPVEAISRMTEVADLLTDVLKKKGLFASIQGKNHVTVEGWTLLGSLLGVFPVVEWVERITDPAEGYKARVTAQTLDGRVVGAGEAFCLRSEEPWSHNPKRGKARDDFALAAMAQTRATSRALRNPLGFVVKMAGYETAGAEEMPQPEVVVKQEWKDYANAGKGEHVAGETITDYIPSEALRSDVAALLVAKEAKTPEAAAAWVEAHVASAGRDAEAFLKRALAQLEAKPDKAAS